MSAPSQAKFYVGDSVTFSHFVNIGWFFDETKLLQLLIEALTEYHKIKGVEDFDFVRLYALDFSIQDLILWKRSQLTHDELITRARETFANSPVKFTKHITNYNHRFLTDGYSTDNVLNDF